MTSPTILRGTNLTTVGGGDQRVPLELACLFLSCILENMSVTGNNAIEKADRPPLLSTRRRMKT